MAVSKQLFPLGLVVATPLALKELEARGMNPSQLITRHVTGDFGDLCDSDKLSNLDAIQNGGRILSAYKIDSSEKVWVITEHDRSSSTVLMSSEY